MERLPEHDRTTLTIAALGRTVSADVARGELVDAAREPFDRIRVRVAAVAGDRIDHVLLSATAAGLSFLRFS